MGFFSKRDKKETPYIRLENCKDAAGHAFEGKIPVDKEVEVGKVGDKTLVAPDCDTLGPFTTNMSREEVLTRINEARGLVHQSPSQK